MNIAYFDAAEGSICHLSYNVKKSKQIDKFLNFLNGTSADDAFFAVAHKDHLDGKFDNEQKARLVTLTKNAELHGCKEPLPDNKA